MIPPLPADSIVERRFVIEGVAGSGGMGTVFRARDLLTGQPVALKLLHELADAARFLREAELLSELRHPGIVSYITHGYTEEGHPFLAMEWLEGCELAQKLKAKGLSLHESLSLMRAAADALAAVHSRDITHRDIKPSNVAPERTRTSTDPQRFEGLASQGLGSGSIFGALSRRPWPRTTAKPPDDLQSFASGMKPCRPACSVTVPRCRPARS